MDYSQSILILVGVCVLVLLIGLLRTKMAWIFNLIIRTVGGTAAICFINYLMEKQNFAGQIGLNPLSLVTSGILGFPGVLLLFGIRIYEML